MGEDVAATTFLQEYEVGGVIEEVGEAPGNKSMLEKQKPQHEMLDNGSSS